MRVRRVVLVAIVIALALAACGSSSGKKAGPTTTVPANTSLGTGVTPTEIKLGVSLIDFSCIRTFTDTIRENQEKNYNVYINDINAKGGVAGRKIVPVYHSFCPIHPEQATAGCTKYTEDEKVFAVVGNIYDPNGNLQTCFAKQHKTPVITFQLSQAIMDKAPPGLIILPGNNPERVDSVLVKLLKLKPELIAGKKIAVLGGAAQRKSITTSLVPSIKELGNETGSTALLNISTSGDTTAAQAQLDSFIERWKGEGTNAIFVTGPEASSKQFVEKIRKQMPNVTLLSDVDTVRDAAREEVAAKMNPNPYEGMISTQGPSRAEYEASDNWKYCAAIYKAQTGTDSPTPTQTLKFPDGKTNDDYGSINDACQILSLFKSIGDKAGQYLNTDTWTSVVDNYGPIVNRGGGQYASLHKGKYDIDDTFRLVTFDSTLLNGTGDFKPETDLQNVPGS